MVCLMYLFNYLNDVSALGNIKNFTKYKICYIIGKTHLRSRGMAIAYFFTVKLYL